MPFDENLPPDIDDVLEAAALLDITEYELFGLAYARWHGRRASEEMLERWFAAYMFRGVVPPWARHFARLVRRRAECGELNPSELGVEQRRATPQMVRRGARYGVALVTSLTALFILASLAAHVMGIGHICMFPPCY